jgi:hypothetical protein
MYGGVSGARWIVGFIYAYCAPTTHQMEEGWVLEPFRITASAFVRLPTVNRRWPTVYFVKRGLPEFVFWCPVEDLV